MDLGLPAFLARLLVVPLRDPERTFDEDLRAFLQVLRDVLTVAVPDDDVQPVRSLLLLTGTVLPSVGDGYGEFSNGSCSVSSSWRTGKGIFLSSRLWEIPVQSLLVDVAWFAGSTAYGVGVMDLFRTGSLGTEPNIPARSRLAVGGAASQLPP